MSYMSCKLWIYDIHFNVKPPSCPSSPTPVIDVMVDPDGTLDALSSLGLTSPLVSEQGVSPNSQAPGGAPLPGGSIASAPPAPEAPAEVAERDTGLDVNRNAAGNGGQENSVPLQWRRRLFVLMWTISLDMQWLPSMRFSNETTIPLGLY